MPRKIVIAGPHMGFNPESHLGGERYEANWLRVQDSPEVEFYWVIRDTLAHTDDLPANHHLHRIKSHRGLRRIAAEARALRSLAKKQKIDLFRFHSVHYDAPVAALLRASGVRTPFLFQHLHVEEPKKKYMMRAKLMARLGAHFVSISHAANDELIALGVPRAQATAIPTLILDWKPEFANMALKRDRRDYDITCVGGLIARKRPEFVIDTAAELQKATPSRKLRVAIIGRGDLLEPLKARAAAAGVNVEFFTNADDRFKWDLLSRSKIFLFPSSQEGFGSAPLEAALAGLWVISSSGGSLPEVLEGLPNAVCVPEERFTASSLAALCRERLESAAPAAPEGKISYWTARSRWRDDHQKVLFQLATRG